jgi:hypothetical protein
VREADADVTGMIEKQVVDRIRHDRIVLRYWDGDQRSYGAACPAAHVALTTCASGGPT